MPVDEVEVDLADVVPAVDQDEQDHQFLRLRDVAFDHPAQAVAAFLGHAGVAVAGQVDQVPAVVDQEMVDELGFPGGGGRLGQLPVVAEEVDERGFPDIRSSDECELGQLPGGFGGDIRAAPRKYGLLDRHLNPPVVFFVTQR